MRPGKLRAPFVHQFAGLVVDDDVVRRVIGQQHDVAFGILDDPMAIIYGSFVIQHAPAWDHAVTMLAMPQRWPCLCVDVRRGDGSLQQMTAIHVWLHCTWDLDLCSAPEGFASG